MSTTPTAITPTAIANSTGYGFYDTGIQTLSSLQEVKAQTEGSTKVTKPDITKQVRDLDTKIKSLLGDGHTASTYTNNINGHQGKATVDILNKNYKQLMEMARDPNLTKANREELKVVIQDIRNLGASLDGSGWYRPNTKPELQDGSKISDGLARVANAFDSILEQSQAPIQIQVPKTLSSEQINKLTATQIQVPRTLSAEDINKLTAIQIQVPSTLSAQEVKNRTSGIPVADAR